MNNGKRLGLYLFVGGIILLLLYGIYQIIQEISGIDIIVAVGLGAIALGAIVLIISIIFEQTGDMKKRKEEIKKEDLEP